MLFPFFPGATLCLLTLFPNSLFPKACSSLSQVYHSNFLSQDKKILGFQHDGLLYSELGS